jgi:hypothetical protein
LDAMPPIGGIPENDIGEFESPEVGLPPFEQLPQAGVFAVNFLLLNSFQAVLFIFAAEGLVFTEQVPAGDDRLAGFFRQIMGDVAQAEQGQEKASDGQFEARGGLVRQTQQDKRERRHASQGNVMRPSQVNSSANVNSKFVSGYER